MDIRQLWYMFREDIFDIPWRFIILIAIIIGAIIPFFTSEPFVLRLITYAAIYAIFAASWDFLTGFTGQLSLGHALFFGLAAYVTALLSIHAHFPWWATIPIGAITGVVAGVIACLPALRLRGFYLALVTLALPIILTGVILIFPNITGGELGVFGISGITPSRITNYYIIFAVMLFSVFTLWKLTDTKSKIVRTGLILRAIREDEITARASGVNTTFFKAVAFALSGFFAGIAGGLYAHSMRVVGPSTLELWTSFNPVIWSIFGGVGTIYGGIVGCYIIVSLLELLRLNPVTDAFRFIIQALVLLSVLLFMPQGLTVWIRDHIEDECPRCKVINAMTRKYCRACRAPMHPEIKTEQ